MAMLTQAFDANSVEPSSPRTVIPAGKYLAQIVTSEMRPTKAGTGQYLALAFAIIDGEFANRQFFVNLNLDNPNQQATEIAHRDLSAICRAAGQMTVSDSEQLHLKPMLVTLKVRPAGPDRQGIEREAQNEVGGYEPAGGAQRQVAQQAARVPAAAVVAKTAAPVRAAMPWANRA